MRRVIAGLAVAGAGFASALSAQEPLWGGDLTSKIDSLAEVTLVDGRVSGFSIGVMRGQEVLLAKGYGYADLDHRAPSGPHTVYNVASITKQFTAAAIMQLVEAGDISLDDPVTRFLPDFTTQGRNVTVRHLLTHTSGVRSYPSDDTPLETLPLDITYADLLDRIEAEPFDFEPGESFRYSNAGYVLLGLLVAEVSGSSYGDYLQDRVFGPLGMSNSSACDLARVTPGRARGYGFEDGALRTVDHDVSPTHMGGAGMLCSSVADLLLWRSAMSRGRVLSTAGYAAMVTPGQLADGTELPYGFGLNVRPRLEGELTVFHGGGATGFSSRLDYYPESDLTIAVLSNTYGSHVGTITDAIARWGLGIPQPTPLDEVRSASELDAYVGSYQVTEPDATWTLTRSGSWLYAQVGQAVPFRLQSQGDHVFTPILNPFTRITFAVDGPRAAGLSLYECTVMDQSRCRTREGVREPQEPR